MAERNLPSIGYDECLSFESPLFDTDLPKFKGQYCWLGIPDIVLNDKTYDELQLEANITSINERISEMRTKRSKNEYNESSRMAAFSISRQLIHEFISINAYQKTFVTGLPVGICIPNTCRPQHIQYAINKSLFKFYVF